jgi:hypothetical protein
VSKRAGVQRKNARTKFSAAGPMAYPVILVRVGQVCSGLLDSNVMRPSPPCPGR